MSGVAGERGRPDPVHTRGAHSDPVRIINVSGRTGGDKPVLIIIPEDDAVSSHGISVVVEFGGQNSGDTILIYLISIFCPAFRVTIFDSISFPTV